MGELAQHLDIPLIDMQVDNGINYNHCTLGWIWDVGAHWREGRGGGGNYKGGQCHIREVDTLKQPVLLRQPELLVSCLAGISRS